MAVANGYGKVATSGSVFMYDTGDTYNSYIGEPTTNVFTHYGTSGPGSASDNAVNFTVQGTTGFVRLGYGQTFGGYTIKPTDVVYKYPLGGYGCHYHGNSAAIGSGKYATFTFDYYVSPGTTIENTYLANLENYGGSALGGGVVAPNSLTGVWQTVTFTLGPTGGSGTQAMFLYPGGCGPRFGDSGYILYKNPQVEFLPHKTPFVQTTRSATQGLLPLVGNSTLDLSEVSFDSNAQIIFDGTNDRLDSGYDLSWNNTNKISIEFLLNPSTISGGNYGIMGKQYPDWEWAFYQNGTSLYLVYWSTAGGHANGMDFGVPAFGTANVWYHVVYTWDGSTSIFYINGTLAGSKTADNPSINQNRSNNVVLGGNTYVWGDSYWSGKLNMVKFYNRNLSITEVKQNYNKYKSRFNLS